MRLGMVVSQWVAGGSPANRQALRSPLRRPKCYHPIPEPAREDCETTKLGIGLGFNPPVPTLETRSDQRSYGNARDDDESEVARQFRAIDDTRVSLGHSKCSTWVHRLFAFWTRPGSAG
jgi:hypothetical protein